MSSVIIVQKREFICGVYSTWKVASDYFSRFIAPITPDDMKFLAETGQTLDVEGEQYSFSQIKVKHGQSNKVSKG